MEGIPTAAAVEWTVVRSCTGAASIVDAPHGPAVASTAAPVVLASLLHFLQRVPVASEMSAGGSDRAAH